MENILLFGGGLDSANLFLYLVKSRIPFSCLHIDYGQKAAEAEIQAVKLFCDKYDVELKLVNDTRILQYNKQPNLMFGTGTNPYIDARNLVLIMTAAEYADNIYIGFYDKNDPVSDANAKFYDSVNAVLAGSFFNRKVQLVAPIIDIPKQQLCKESYKFEPEFFKWTMTCWLPVDGKECGHCKHCLKKKEIYEKASHN